MWEGIARSARGGCWDYTYSCLWCAFYFLKFFRIEYLYCHCQGWRINDPEDQGVYLKIASINRYKKDGRQTDTHTYNATHVQNTYIYNSCNCSHWHPLTRVQNTHIYNSCNCTIPYCCVCICLLLFWIDLYRLPDGNSSNSEWRCEVSFMMFWTPKEQCSSSSVIQ